MGAWKAPPCMIFLFPYSYPSVVTGLIFRLYYYKSFGTEAGWFMFLQHLVHSSSRPQFGLQGAVVTQMRKKLSVKKSSRLVHEATSEKRTSKQCRVISFNILYEYLQETSCWLHSVQKGRLDCLFWSGQLGTGTGAWETNNTRVKTFTYSWL